MPELPEVETTVNILKKKVLNRTFLDVWTDWPKLVKTPLLKKKIKGKKIKEIERIGKNIVFRLSDKTSLLIHQKLTGHLLYNPDKKAKFIHFIFFLDNNSQIALSDLRKFAKIELKGTKEINDELSSLGPDALKITFNQFKKALSQTKKRIKTALMDQRIISGIGNIYSDESLFLARIHPLKRASELKEEQIKALYSCLKKVLRQAIKHQGSSVSDYKTPNGKEGSFTKKLKVYRRQGKKCYFCGSIIKRIRINGRSAHFCPKCQKL